MANNTKAITRRGANIDTDGIYQEARTLALQKHGKPAMRMVDDLPSDTEAERLLLGGILRSSDLLRDVQDSLEEIDFSSNAHRRIYSHAAAMWKEGTPLDRVTLASRLMDHKELDSVGGLGYLIELETNTPNLPRFDGYVISIRDKSIRRQAILRLNEFTWRLREPGDSAEVLAMAEKTIADLGGELKQRSGFTTPGEIIESAGGLDKYLDRRRESGIMTPWETLNDIIGGFQPGNLIVLAGHTGTGKTTLALNLAHYAARGGSGVAIFSMEMDGREVNDRLLCIQGGFDSRVLKGKDENEERDEARRKVVQRAVTSLSGMPVYISDSAAMTVPAMHSRVRKLLAKTDIGLVIVDYLQLVKGVGRFDKRVDEISDISRGLKRMAQDLRRPVIALSQFSRESAKQGRVPELHDLRDGGSIENDSNLVMLMHFTERYDLSAGKQFGNLDLIVAKQRSGPVGAVKMRFYAPSGVFTEAGK